MQLDLSLQSDPLRHGRAALAGQTRQAAQTTTKGNCHRDNSEAADTTYTWAESALKAWSGPALQVRAGSTSLWMRPLRIGEVQ